MLSCYLLKHETFTCAGVVIVTVAGVAGAGVLGVETAGGWGRELCPGCEEAEEEEEEEVTVAWTGVRGAVFVAGGSGRSALFSG